MISADTLAALPLFADVPSQVVEALARRAMEVRYGADAVMFLAGSEPRGWYIVLEGNVRVVRGGGGRQHVIHTEAPGGTLGEVPLFAGETHPGTAIASEPTRCALLDRDSLAAAMRDAPDLGFLIARRLALRVRTLVNRLDARSARGVRSRLAEFLLERQAASRAATFSLGMTQREVAEELGTVREVIGREMQAFARQGAIASRGGGRYAVLDIAALQAAARE